MAFDIKIVGVPGICLDPRDNSSSGQTLIGSYIKSFDPNDRYPRGVITTTPHRHCALKFRRMTDATSYMMQEVGGARPDGKPNRPLMAFSVVIEYDKEGSLYTVHAN